MTEVYRNLKVCNANVNKQITLDNTFSDITSRRLKVPLTLTLCPKAGGLKFLSRFSKFGFQGCYLWRELSQRLKWIKLMCKFVQCNTKQLPAIILSLSDLGPILQNVVPFTKVVDQPSKPSDFLCRVTLT